MQIEVVYALPQQQWCWTVELPVGSNVAAALAEIERQRLLAGLDIGAVAELKVGVFGVLCDDQRVLLDGERLEIYRPLQTDAKTARRLRAQAEVRR